MPKAETALVPSFDIETYKTNSEALNQGPSLITLIGASRALLERGLQSEEDYQSAVLMGNEAASQAKKHTDNFDPLCKGLHGLHKMATGLREKYSSPWTKISDALRAAARRWYLDAEAAKKQAEQELLKQAKQIQKGVLEEAQELIDQGFVKEGREKLRQAQAVVAPPVLPEAVPQVEGARVTPKFKGTCEDLLAVLGDIVAGRVDLMWEVRGEMRPLVVVDQVVLNSIVDRLGPNFKCAGIKVERDVQIGAKRL